MPKGIYLRKHIGMKHSEETKEKMRLSHTGKVFSEEHKRNLSISKKGKPLSEKNRMSLRGGNLGKKHTIEHNEKIRLANTGRKMSEEWKEKHRGINHPAYKHGLSRTKRYKSFINKIRYSRIKNGGKPSVQLIQMIYEDNIKKYGTLTCYLCELPIEFGNDQLEHKIPLCRGGNSLYENLAVACQKCNCKKHDKTEQEYRKEK